MELNLSENSFSSQNLSLKIPWSYPSIRSSIQQRLFVLLLGNRQNEKTPISPSKITLYRLKSSLGYRCAIALQLARGETREAQVLGEQLIKGLAQLSLSQSDRPLLDFTVRVVESGWLDFHLSDRALAICLQQLPQIFCLTYRKQVTQEIVANLFASQYAHARCCSLLRLGHRDGLIQLYNTDFSQSVWQWQSPNPIPWFYLVNAIEKQMISQILTIVDQLDSNDTENWIKLATDLSEAVLHFERYCRIWGEVKQETPELSQARLGLLAIAQLLLQQLLQEKIGVWAPVEL
jgi:hypothetical protein